MSLLSILVPAFDERRTLLTILSRILDVDLRPLGLSKEILLVDDASRDGTREIVEALARDWQAVMADALRKRGIDVGKALAGAEMRVLFHPVNRGKGAAIRTALAEARGEYVLIQDADLEYDPRDYPRLLNPLLDGRADVVYGSRFLGQERAVLYFWHSVGNRLLTTLSNAVNDLNLTDLETCYKAFRADVLKGLKLVSDRFGFEPEVTAKLARMGYRFYEVPVNYSGRGYEGGKKITWRDGIAAVFHILRHAFTGDLVEEGVVEETLVKMRRQRRLNEHLFRAIEPWLGRRILEAGSGHGNLTDHLLGVGDVVATDLDPSALRRLQATHAAFDNIRVLRWDMTEPLPAEGEDGGPIDTIVCLNVLEHIEDHLAALRNAARVLATARGRLVLLVPAWPSLHSPLDRALGHARRYSRTSLGEALRAAGFEVEHLGWFNLLGLPGWWLNGKVLRRERLPVLQLGFYALLARVWLPLERRIPLPAGLSLLAVARPTLGAGPSLP